MSNKTKWGCYIVIVPVLVLLAWMVSNVVGLIFGGGFDPS